MKSILVLENIRSAYNVGNLIRTADGLGREVIISGYTPHPAEQEKVRKTSLGAEGVVLSKHFREPSETIDYLVQKNYVLVAGEKTEHSFSLEELGTKGVTFKDYAGVALVLGNEKTGVLDETLFRADFIVHISMQGMKESFNVGQAGAILMREINKIVKNS